MWNWIVLVVAQVWAGSKPRGCTSQNGELFYMRTASVTKAFRRETLVPFYQGARSAASAVGLVEAVWLRDPGLGGKPAGLVLRVS